MLFTPRAVGSAARCSFVALAVLSTACSPPSDHPSPPWTSGSGGIASAGSSGSQAGGMAPMGGSGGTSAGLAGTTSASGGTSAGTPSFGGAGMGGVGGAAGGGGVSAAAGEGGMSAATGGGGAAGGPAMPDVCGAMSAGNVTFSVPSGAFEGSLSVELRTMLAGAEIRYTTDHTAPTASSMLYAGTPLAITSTTRLIAQSFLQGVAAGPAQTAVYIPRAFEQLHDLPVIVLDTYGTPVPGQESGSAATDAYIDTALLAFEPNSGMTSLAAMPQVASAAGIHIRGQSSSNYAKKPYRVELHDADGSDRDCPMLGMPSESDWVLHSPFPDKALIRNAFVYSLGRDIGMAAPRAKFAEVYLNTAARPVQASDYMGVYLLVEKIKNQKERLNLQQLEPEDTALPAIAGGYIFKFEWRVMDIEQLLPCPSGQQNCWDYLEVYDPKPWNPEQQDYLANHLNTFVTALHSATPSDETTGYPAFIDVRSFATQVILHELTRNLDAYTRSQYLFKDREGKINAGPLWDYDLIAGVGRRNTGLETEGWQHESMASRFTITADWFPQLIADPAFTTAVIARWKELRQTELSDARVTARIADLTAGLAAGAARNFQKWDNLAAASVGGFDTPTAATWDGQVTAMRDWLLTRMAWLDTVWL